MQRLQPCLAVFLIWSGLLWAQSATVTAHVQLTSPARHNSNAAGAVVWLTPADSSSSLSVAPKHFRVVQHDKQFSPHLLVVPVGSTVEFPNRDPFFHNVFSLFEGKRFDLGLYEAGGNRSVHFDRVGVSYIFCNIHSEMSAVIVALATPYYGVSARSGDVRIENVPPGRYLLRVWHEASPPESLKALTREVTISTSTLSLGSLRVSDDDRLQLGHKNKYGEDYAPPAPSTPMYPH